MYNSLKTFGALLCAFNIQITGAGFSPVMPEEGTAETSAPTETASEVSSEDDDFWNNNCTDLPVVETTTEDVVEVQVDYVLPKTEYEPHPEFVEEPEPVSQETYTAPTAEEAPVSEAMPETTETTEVATEDEDDFWSHCDMGTAVVTTNRSSVEVETEYVLSKTEYEPHPEIVEEPEPVSQGTYTAPAVSTEPAPSESVQEEPRPRLTDPRNIYLPMTLYTNYEVVTDKAGVQKFYRVDYETASAGVKVYRNEIEALPDDAIRYTFDLGDEPGITGYYDVIRSFVDSHRNPSEPEYDYETAKAKIENMQKLSRIQLKEQMDREAAERKQAAEAERLAEEARKAAEEAARQAAGSEKEERTYNYHEFMNWAAPNCTSAHRLENIKEIQSATGSNLTKTEEETVRSAVFNELNETRRDYDYYEAYGVTRGANELKAAELGASEWADVMIRSGYFAHANLKGEKGTAGLGYKMTSENILFFTAREALTPEYIAKKASELWNDSNSHHENRINMYWKYYDIGVSCSDNGCVLVERFAK
ncbi:MAG: hypothetical protein IJJ29_07455 [Solobacterium sp.]|nr:hypothetical protein [Solobacterium sp.]